jgi:hypothetical protein
VCVTSNVSDLVFGIEGEAGWLERQLKHAEPGKMWGRTAEFRVSECHGRKRMSRRRAKQLCQDIL